MIEVIGFYADTHALTLLAQAAGDAADNGENIRECAGALFTSNSFALSCGAAASRALAEGWNETWDTKILVASPEFISMMNISRYIAGPAIAFWAIKGMKELSRNGFAEIWQSFIPVVLIALVLYPNNAYLARRGVLAGRDLMNYQNQTILELANEAAQIEDKYQAIADYASIDNALVAQREQCNGVTRVGEMEECLKEAEIAAQALLDKYREERGDDQFLGRMTNYVRDVISNPRERLTNLIKNDPATIVATIAGGPFAGLVAYVGGKVVNSGMAIAAEGILAASNTLIQHMVELAWLFSALVLPIPLALAFYPGTSGILVGWLTGFLTLGLFKINLNIATSVIVTMMYARPPGEPVFDIALLSIGSTVIAGGMTAVNGFVIFSGLQTAIAGVTTAVLRTSVGIAGGRL